MSQKVLDSLHPDFRPLVVAALAELEQTHGIKCEPYCGLRTIKEQDREYAKGRDAKGNVIGKITTKAKGGQSPHQFGRAVDVCPYKPHTNELWWDAPDDIWNVIHLHFEELCYTDDRYLDSGYDWKFRDAPHVEDPRWKEDRAAYLRGELKIV